MTLFRLNKSNLRYFWGTNRITLKFMGTNTEELLKMRTCDMTVAELMETVSILHQASPTMTLDLYCKIKNQEKEYVYSLLNNKLLPEEIIVGGYEGRKKGKAVMFYTEKVLELIK